MRKIILASLYTVICGCSSLGITEQKVVKFQSLAPNDEVVMASIPTQLRGTYVTHIPIDNEHKAYTYCAEPFSDVAASSTIKATMEATNKLNSILESQASAKAPDGTSNDISGKSNQSVEQLASGTMDIVNTIVTLEGRTQYVLLAREMLFRTCESAANGSLGTTRQETATHVRQEHTEIINALTQMLVTEQKKAQAQSDTAVAAVAKEVAAKNLDSKILESMSKFDINSVMRNALMSELNTCLSGAKDDKTKASCATTYSQQNAALGK